MMSWEEIVTYFNSGGWPLRCPWWVEMPSTKYSRYTRDTIDRGMLNDRTTSEMECPIRLAPNIMPRSNSNNSRRLAMSRLAGVQTDSRENTSQLILLWAFPSRQGTVAPLKNKFTYCYPMTFGTSVQFYINIGTFSYILLLSYLLDDSEIRQIFHNFLLLFLSHLPPFLLLLLVTAQAYAHSDLIQSLPG
jgi:hypothetical protein